MQKHSISIAGTILGLAIFLLGGLIGKVTARGISFSIDDLLINIAATFFSLAILALMYETLGGEPVINAIRDLNKKLNIAKNIEDIGVEKIVTARRHLNYEEEVHKDLQNGNQMFIVSRTLQSITYQDVKRLFKSYLTKKHTSIRILIGKRDYIETIKTFIQEEINEGQRDRIKVKLLENGITFCMYGTETKLYITPYLKHCIGDDSPSIVCQKKNNNCLYDIYSKDFEKLWNDEKTEEVCKNQ